MSCVLTLAPDDAAQQRFESLRQQWFPPERNLIPAHVTLFHTLPDTVATQDTVLATAAVTQSFAVRVSGVRSLGRGVAYVLESAEALAVHRRLRSAFDDAVTAQDRQGFRPHVVVQNKVSTDQARETLAVLQAGFSAWECRAVGLDLWRYLGGPWEHLRRFAFTN